MGFRTPGVLRRAVDNARFSRCWTARIESLDFRRWYSDTIGGDLYLHVRHRARFGLGDTVHRVFPGRIRGYVCRRLEQTLTRLYWVYDERKGKS